MQGKLIHARIAQQRERAGLSTGQLAQLSGVPKKEIERIETGIPREDGKDEELRVLLKLATACATTLAYFYGQEMPEAPSGLAAGTFILCSRRGNIRARACGDCGLKTKDYVLCDGPTKVPGRTCSKPVCRGCATHVGGMDIDFCRGHAALAPAKVAEALEKAPPGGDPVPAPGVGADGAGKPKEALPRHFEVSPPILDGEVIVACRCRGGCGARGPDRWAPADNHDAQRQAGCDSADAAGFRAGLCAACRGEPAKKPPAQPRIAGPSSRGPRSSR